MDLIVVDFRFNQGDFFFDITQAIAQCGLDIDAVNAGLAHDGEDFIGVGIGLLPFSGIVAA